MPTYDFVCNDCKKSFSLTMSMAAYAKRKSFKCPKCESRHVQRRVSAFFAVTSKKS